ncbi:hypothetical protein CYMTET_34335 [Cymbomonas tetramitiformis]|uniref:EF-hand domain-containing protein n=1 Tax=Cymbomonas tetramitiformis TaxID=36881 RepID=A0AAE0FBF4_9CHLO|nr:hypothetical protein CYMTET_34335 [Cymbomonas tetramitiformis]
MDGAAHELMQGSEPGGGVEALTSFITEHERVMPPGIAPSRPATGMRPPTGMSGYNERYKDETVQEFNEAVERLHDVFHKKGRHNLQHHLQRMAVGSQNTVPKEQIHAALAHLQLGMNPEDLDEVLQAFTSSDGDVDYTEFCDALLAGRLPFKSMDGILGASSEASGLHPNPGRRMRQKPLTRSPWGLMSDVDENLEMQDSKQRSTIDILQKTFAQYSGGSKNLNKEQFSKAMHALKIYLSDRDIDRLWMRVDKDNMGSIKYDTLLTMATPPKGAPSSKASSQIPEFMKPKALRTSLDGNIWEWDTSGQAERDRVPSAMSSVPEEHEPLTPLGRGRVPPRTAATSEAASETSRYKGRSPGGSASGFPRSEILILD